MTYDEAIARAKEMETEMHEATCVYYQSGDWKASTYLAWRSAVALHPFLVGWLSVNTEEQNKSWHAVADFSITRRLSI